MEKTFSRVHSTKDIIITCGLTAAGCVLVALPTGASINILGFFLIITGIILFFLLKTGYKDQDGLRYCKSERYFSQNMRSSLIENIERQPNKIDLSEEDKGNAVRLDIYCCNKTGKSYLQVFEYIPYKYEPCSKQYEHAISEISKIK